jgi:transposase
MIDTILPGSAALDLGHDKIFVAVANAPVRSFGTYSKDLRLLATWLHEHQVRAVAMEATGVLWINPHDFLKKEGFAVTLFHGAHARNLPGRKSDVQDCQWHAMLHSHGLLAPCFVPPEEILQLRSYCRLREDHLAIASAHIQHMQRALDLLNVRVHTVLSQIHGVSGLQIVEAILAGVRDPEALAALCDSRVLAKKRAALVASLEGHWQEHHLFALRQAYEAYGFCQQQMTACDQKIEAALQQINARRPVVPREEKRKVKITRHNRPQIEDLYGQLLTACGGRDAQLLPAIAPLSWLKLIGELGTDLSHWHTERHFTAWLGLSPGHHQSGQRRRRIPRRKTRAGQIFREAVMSLARSKDCALGEFYRRIRATRGAPVAIVATARKLAEHYWRVMVKGVEYAERGLTEYTQRLQAQRERSLRRRAAQMGFSLQPLPTPNPGVESCVH